MISLFWLIGWKYMYYFNLHQWLALKMSSNDKSKLHFSFFSLVLFTLFTYIDGQPSLASRYEAKCEQTSAYLNISYGWRSHFVSIFSLSACSALCGREAECLSLNFCEDWTCTLSDRTLDSTGLQCHEIRSQIRCTYLEKVCKLLIETIRNKLNLNEQWINWIIFPCQNNRNTHCLYAIRKPFEDMTI